MMTQRKTRPAVILLTTAFLLAGSAGLLAGCNDAAGACSYGGKRYRPGDTINDGCMLCTCNSDRSVTCNEQPDCDDCEHDVVPYSIGDSFPAGDGCNLCQCVAQDEVECTTAACGTSCIYAGVQYTSGQSFDALDGCNSCTCEVDGSVACTEKACACDVDKEWWRSYLATDPNCTTDAQDCLGTSTPFSNSCGCGCEQDSSCAPTYDCAPPNQCDLEKLKQDCPFSEITE